MQPGSAVTRALGGPQLGPSGAGREGVGDARLAGKRRVNGSFARSQSICFQGRVITHAAGENKKSCSFLWGGRGRGILIQEVHFR